MKRLPTKFFEADAVTLAPKLLGKIIKKGTCVGRIVEVEAYAADPASHAYKITPRSAVMRDTYGVWYVYFTYGMHYCANVTCDKDGIGAVLIRAVEPLEGIEVMARRRGIALRADKKGAATLSNGPAKWCQAFGINKKQNGLPLSDDFGIYDGPAISRNEIEIGPRIGISAGLDLPWRFYLKNNPFVSKQ